MPRDALGFYGYRVRDVMTRPVVSVESTASLTDAASRMSRRRISGLPVVGPGGRLLGVVSQKDILRILVDRAGLRLPGSVFDLVLARSAAGRSDLAEACRRELDRSRVRDAMSHPAISVDPDASLDDAVKTMVQAKINRLPVVARGKMIGIVTRTDLLSGLSTGGPTSP
ncbi:MAG TPA: CBS domain-containing protein [Thermoplasmata archaeon]